MKKIISILMVLMIILLNSVVYASTLNIDVTSDKETVEKGEEVLIKVDWKDGMQAADFILNYDDKRFEFIESDLKDFCVSGDSKITVAWVSLDNSYRESAEFKFRAKKSGVSNFSVKIDAGFSNGEFDTTSKELITVENYNINNTSVTVEGLVPEERIPIIVLIVVIIILIALCLFFSKKKVVNIGRRR